jgi:hypothetical protein
MGQDCWVNDDRDDDLSANNAVSVPVATFRKEALVGKDDSERPSHRWLKRQRQVLNPIIAVSVASAAAAAVMGALRIVGPEIGAGFIAVVPVVVGLLASLFEVHPSDRPPPHQDGHSSDVRFHKHRRAEVNRRIWQGVTAGVLASLVAGGILAQEGVICLLMAAPFYWGGALAVAMFFAKPVRSALRDRLRREDAKWLNEHRVGKLPPLLIIVFLVPLLGTAIDRWCFIDLDARRDIRSSVVVAVGQAEAWSSLHQLDLSDIHMPDTWAAPLLPKPVRIVGSALAVGDVREVVFNNGALTATVTRIDPPNRYDIDVDVAWAGREFFDHWIDIERSRFELTVIDDKHTRVTHVTTYRPLLFPRALFEPLERAWGDPIHDALLEAHQQRLARTHHAGVAALP